MTKTIMLERRSRRSKSLTYVMCKKLLSNRLVSSGKLLVHNSSEDWTWISFLAVQDSSIGDLVTHSVSE